jgi:hypothetical protein
MDEIEMAPKVFVSHASEDKVRFVLEFATRLRAKGVDAWLDKWEMQPGDSLVDKIFEEGLKEAKAVIVVLSKNSVQKPWVREELNAAIVKRINHGSRLIPVIIDDCQVPEALSNTFWVSIDNLDDYENSLDRIVGSIFGFTDRPPLGPLPTYAGNSVSCIGNLNKVDSLVMKLSCEATLIGRDTILSPSIVFQLDTQPLIPEQELRDSLEILDQHGSVEQLRTLGGGLFDYQVTEAGFELYARSSLPKYDETILTVMLLIANEKLTDNLAIAGRINAPVYLINHILGNLQHKGSINFTKTIGGKYEIHNVNASLRRAIQEIT